jgi:hypothetical protein
LARAIYFLREQRQRFKLEILALAVFFSIAIGVGFTWLYLAAGIKRNFYSQLQYPDWSCLFYCSINITELSIDHS